MKYLILFIVLLTFIGCNNNPYDKERNDDDLNLERQLIVKKASDSIESYRAVADYYKNFK